ncbi:hypothetical protein [Streptomyces lavendofoliae]|uniref:hypothetical protein n=1 Tax=Streptomyces lavendofoliae TaxID=67314 RepID=UPI003D8D8B01
MADVYELVLALDLRDLSGAEVAELRWHLGLGPQPETLTIVRSFPVVHEDEDGRLVMAEEPVALLGHHGEAWKVGGALTSALVGRPSGGWALTSRQEIHPDRSGEVGELLAWLAARTTDDHRRPGDQVRLGWIRFYEEDRPAALTVRDGAVMWPQPPVRWCAAGA